MLMFHHKNKDGSLEFCSINAYAPDSKSGEEAGVVTVSIAHENERETEVGVNMNPVKAIRFAATLTDDDKTFFSTTELLDDGLVMHLNLERDKSRTGAKLSIYERFNDAEKGISRTFIFSPAECLAIAEGVKSAMSKLCFGI